MSLSVVTFLWSDPRYRWNPLFLYGSDHVRRLRNMVARNLAMPHRFVCVTDRPEAIDDDIETVPLWSDLADMGRCWRRLRAFAPDMAGLLGERFCWLDLDCVIVGDITPLMRRSEDFLVWRRRSGPLYCGSMVMMTAGARREVWEDFDPEISPGRCDAMCGSDQAWMLHRLGRNEAGWTEADGVLSFRSLARPGVPQGMARRRGQAVSLPQHARIVFFHGPFDPSQQEQQQAFPWIAEHWR